MGQPCSKIEIEEGTLVSVTLIVSVVVSCSVIVEKHVSVNLAVVVSKQVEVSVNVNVESPHPAAHVELVLAELILPLATSA
jgi:hypothetical protein